MLVPESQLIETYAIIFLQAPSVGRSGLGNSEQLDPAQRNSTVVERSDFRQ